MLKKTGQRIGILTVLAVLLCLLAAPVAFADDAGGLKIEETSPSDGKENVPIDNVGIKLYFNGNVTSPDVWAQNAASFSLIGSDGKEVTTTAFQGLKDDESNYILVIPGNEEQTVQLNQSSVYTLKIAGTLMDTTGRTLGDEQEVSFTTMDMNKNSKLSMFLMVGMMVALVVFMVFNSTRKMKAEAEAAALMKANPYRVAKERGISVDEARDIIEKAKERNRKMLEKTGGKAPEPAEKKSGGGSGSGSGAKALPPKKDVKKVKKPSPIAAAGGKYRTGRKAEAERKAKAEAARKAAAGKGGSGSSGAKKASKGKGKKK